LRAERTSLGVEVFEACEADHVLGTIGYFDCFLTQGMPAPAVCMVINFNHTIVWGRDSQASATFLADVLGLNAPKRWGPFLVVTTDNGTNMDFMDADGEIAPQHYAFLVSETEFDEIFGRVRARSLPYGADPAQTQPGEINDHDDGRGFYFKDPDGHFLEVITRPYGSRGYNP
jgi:catechol 2,3-dioxygenase-like lactoylglutathione lyase family enzyme